MTRKEYKRRRFDALRTQFWSGITMAIMSILVPTGATVALLPLGIVLTAAASKDRCLFYI